MVEKNKLKNIIKEEINELKLNDTLDTIIFTTYSFDTLFFETQLLPYLFDIPNYKSIKNRSRFIAIDLNEKIKTNIKVYYDHLVGEYESTVRYRASKKIIENGIFHPKLIILIGKKNLKVIVLSANLTTSSYGINQEVLGSIKVNSNTIQKIEKEIGNKLSLENDIKKILTALNNNIDDLIITGLNHQYCYLKQ